MINDEMIMRKILLIMDLRNGLQNSQENTNFKEEINMPTL